jgi:hypothetical protein
MMHNQPLIRLERPRLLTSDPVALPLEGAYSGGTVIYDLQAALDYYDHYQEYTRDLQRAVRVAARALEVARAAVGTSDPPEKPALTADETAWEAYWMALDAESVAVEAARAAHIAAQRAFFLAVIGLVVVEVQFPDAADTPDPIPTDPATWAGWETAALGWLATTGLETGISQLRTPAPKPAGPEPPVPEPAPVSEIASGPSSSTAHSRKGRWAATLPGGPVAAPPESPGPP